MIHEREFQLQSRDQNAAGFAPPSPQFPFGGWWCSEFTGWLAESRLEQGLTVVFPGIEGLSWWNISIARGLADAGHPAAMTIEDWTTGNRLFSLYHLVSERRNRERAHQIAAQLQQYRAKFPSAPIRLLGHSGGGAMCVFVLEALPAEFRVCDTVLLNAALSPDYNLSPALTRVSRKLWNVRSVWDLLFLGLGTTTLGTVDRRHTSSAGRIGFRMSPSLSPLETELYKSRFDDIAFDSSMIRDGNWGGHFGCVQRRFISRHIAPLLVG